MRLDHIAYRVKDRQKTANFFIEAFGYRVQTEFDLKFDDGTTARCIALEPPEKLVSKQDVPWSYFQDSTYHLPPEIFVSDGVPGSIVWEWVEKRNGVGGIHHVAYQVDSVENTMEEWRKKGYAEFTTKEALKCPGLTQVFTKPSELTGVIYEFIERGKNGFCQDNVKDLMNSTKGIQ